MFIESEKLDPVIIIGKLVLTSDWTWIRILDNCI